MVDGIPITSRERTRCAELRIQVIPDAADERFVMLACGLPCIAPALAPDDDGSLFENVTTPHDHARARGWVELNEKPSKDRITE